MVPRKQGLIVNISSVGGMRYLFNVAYGVGKVKFLESFLSLSLFSFFLQNPIKTTYRKPVTEWQLIVELS